MNINRLCKIFKSGFTIAEVLITLGIIGIVAQMTIPVLMKNVSEIEYYSGAKKAYSTLSQAVLLIEANPNLTMDSTTQYTLRDSFLKVMKSVKKGTDAQVFGSTLYYHHKCTNSFGSLNFSQGASASDDSQMFAIYPNANCNNLINGSCAWIYVDTNGLKKPNMNGYDLVGFWLLKKNDVYMIKPLGVPGSGDGYSCSASCTNDEMTSDGCSYQRVMGLPVP